MPHPWFSLHRIICAVAWRMEEQAFAIVSRYKLCVIIVITGKLVCCSALQQSIIMCLERVSSDTSWNESSILDTTTDVMVDGVLPNCLTCWPVWLPDVYIQLRAWSEIKYKNIMIELLPC